MSSRTRLRAKFKQIGGLLAPKTWRWYSYISRAPLVLGLHKNLKQLVSCSELALVETWVRCQLLGLLVPREIWRLFQSNRVADRILLVGCHLGTLLCTLVQHCKHVSHCLACSGLALDGVANTILSRRCLSLQTRPISLRITFLNLYLLIVDTNFSGVRPFGIFTQVSKADPRLSCNCSVGLALWLTDDVDFGSIGFYVPPGLDILSHFHIFCEGKMTNILSSFARRGSTNYPSQLYSNGERFTSCTFCSPMGVVAHKHRHLGWCQLP